MSRPSRLLVLVASTSLVACTARRDPWWYDLGDPDWAASTENVNDTCKWARDPEEPQLLASCQLQGRAPLTLAEVSGLDSMPAPLAACTLAGLPSLVGQGDDPAQCHPGIAEALSRRLTHLGWRANTVKPREKLSLQPSPGHELLVWLERRHRLGRIFVVHDPSNEDSLAERITREVERAIPDHRWATRASLEKIRQRVIELKGFRTISVNLGPAPSIEEKPRVAVLVDVRM